MVLGEGGAKMQGMVCFMTVKNLMAVSFLKPYMADALHVEEQLLAVVVMVQVHVAFAKEEAAS